MLHVRCVAGAHVPGVWNVGAADAAPRLGSSAIRSGFEVRILLEQEPVITPWLVDSLHSVALGIGLGAVVVRGSTLRGALDTEGLGRVFRADRAWTLALVLWIGTGAAWAYLGVEGGWSRYLSSDALLYKAGLFLLIVLLEIRPRTTLFAWRRRLRRNELVDTRRAPALSRISFIEAALLVLTVFAASAMERGLFS